MPIIVDHLVHEYGVGTKLKVKALDVEELVIPDGQFVGLIGHTGSGKTTLVQHIAALLKPSSGTVYLDGEDIFDKGYDKKILRKKIGVVFQYPEHQLFEASVFEDVCFGPRNLGAEKGEAQLRAFEALHMVGIEDEYFYRSPFELSGGQKRRVAIAGALAMNPQILILDEPTAGLDPKGRDEILGCIRNLQQKRALTVILVSHSMEDVANYVERLVVMHNGSVFMDGSVKQVFEKVEELEEIGLAVPQVTYLMKNLQKKGLPVANGITTLEEAQKAILSII